jgi:hypothetical protein
MGSPRGFPKGLDFAGCLNVTLVLRDFQVLTGRFRGLIGERDYDDDDYGDKHKKKDDKCCKPPKVDIEVEVEEESKFVLLELTRPAAAANLSSFTCVTTDGTVTGVDLVVSGTTFPVGACVAVNVENIIYAGTNPEFCDIPIGITFAVAGAGLTVSFRK